MWRYLLAIVLIGVGGAAADGNDAVPSEADGTRELRIADEPATDRYGDPLPPGAVGRLGTMRWQHAGMVHDVAFTPDDQVLVSGSADGTVRLWDAESGKELRRLSVDRSWVRSVSVSHDGKFLAAATEPVTVWEVATGNVVNRVSADSRAYTVAFSPDGKTLATGHQDGTYRLWEVESGKPVQTFREDKVFISSVAISADGKLLATTAVQPNLKGLVTLWNTESGAMVRRLSGHDRYVQGIDFAPDGRTLVSSGEDSAVRLWDVAIGEIIRSFEGHDHQVLGVRFAPDGKTLATCSGDGTVRIWNAATGEQLQRLDQGFVGNVYAAAFTSDGQRLAVCSNSGRIRLWDLSRGEEILRLPDHDGSAVALAFAPDGKSLVSGSRSAKQWSVETSSLVHVLLDGPDRISSVAFSPDGKSIAAGTGQRLYVWDAATGRESLAAPARAWRVGFTGLNRVLAGDWRSTEVWEIATGQRLLHLERPLQAIGPDGTAVSAQGTKLSLWKAETPDKPLTIEVPVPDTPSRNDPRTGLPLEKRVEARCFAFTPDGKTLAASVRAVLTNGGEGAGAIYDWYAETIHLWNVETGKEIKRIVPPLTDQAAQRPIDCLAFAPDGHTLAAGGRISGDGAVPDALVIFWDVATAAEVHRIRIPRVTNIGTVQCLAFAPDGRTIATGGTDSTVLIWKLELPAWKKSP